MDQGIVVCGQVRSQNHFYTTLFNHAVASTSSTPEHERLRIIRGRRTISQCGSMESSHSQPRERQVRELTQDEIEFVSSCCVTTLETRRSSNAIHRLDRRRCEVRGKPKAM